MSRSFSLLRLASARWADWLAVLLLAALAVGLQFVEPFERVFFVADLSIAHPLKTDTVSVPVLFFIGIGIPVLFIFFVSFVRRSWLELHNGLLGLAFAALLTSIVTDIAKNTVGRMRPDFLSRCEPIYDNSTSLLEPLSPDTCTGSDALVIDGRKSFPSGHSSLSFVGMTYLSLYMRLFPRRVWFAAAEQITFLMARVVLFMIPLVGAALVAISRTTDYRHHWEDVVAGAVIGILFAWIGFRSQFAPNNSRQDHDCHYQSLNTGGHQEITTQDAVYEAVVWTPVTHPILTSGDTMHRSAMEPEPV